MKLIIRALIPYIITTLVVVSLCVGLGTPWYTNLAIAYLVFKLDDPGAQFVV